MQIQPLGVQLPDKAHRGGADRICQTEDADEVLVLLQAHQGAFSVGPREVHAEEAGIAQAVGATPQGARDSAPRVGPEAFHRFHLLPLRGLTEALGQWVLGIPLQGSGQAHQVVLGPPAEGVHFLQGRPPLGEGAGLVEGQVREVRQTLEGIGFPDQQSVPGGGAQGRGHGHGCGQA